MSNVIRFFAAGGPWFSRYIWRFKAGKAGIALIAVGSFLDFHSRVEIFYKWVDVLMRPATLLILQSGVFHLALIALGFVLLYWSTVRGKVAEPKLSIGERLEKLEVIHGPGNEHIRSYVQALHATEKVNVFGRAAIDTGKLVPDRTLVQMSLFDIVREFGGITTDFNLLRDTYGWDTAPALAPFSKWRPTSLAGITTDLTREWERWARRLVAHKQQCYFVGVRHGIEVDGGELFTRIMNWGDSTTSGDAVMELLNNHAAKLRKIREDHAASWVTAVEERFTKS